MNACRLSIFGYTEPLKSPLWSTPKTSHGFRNSRPLIAECRPVPRRGCGETGGGDPWRLSTTFLPQQAFTNPNPGLRAYLLSAEGRATCSLRSLKQRSIIPFLSPSFIPRRRAHIILKTISPPYFYLRDRPFLYNPTLLIPRPPSSPLPQAFSPHDSAMPVSSRYPPVDIPDLDIWSFLFERKDKPFPDDKGMYILSPPSQHFIRSTIIELSTCAAGILRSRIPR